MAPVIYKFDSSPPARAVMMVADLLDLKVEYRDLNPVLREQDSPENLKINPMKTIPFLDDNGFYLADSHAIMLYLIEKYGTSDHSYLYPEDPKIRATIHQRLFFDCGVLFQRLRAIMGPTYYRNLTELSKIMKQNIEEAYTVLESYLSEHKFAASDHITVADLSLLTTASALNGLYQVNAQRYPKISEWLKEMSKKDVCKRINEPGNLLLVNTLKSFMNNNKETLAKL